MLHKEAKRCKLETCSRGLGPDRTLCVLPRGERAPQPTPYVRDVAALVQRVSRRAFEESGESLAPYSVGEFEELVAAAVDGEAPPDNVAALILSARSALLTLPSARRGGAEDDGHRTRWAYERVLCINGRVCGDVVAADDGAGAVAAKSGRKDWRPNAKKGRGR